MLAGVSDVELSLTHSRDDVSLVAVLCDALAHGDASSGIASLPQ